MTSINVSMTNCYLFILFVACSLWFQLQPVYAGCGSYNRETETCCRGKVYQGANLSCCDTSVYDPDFKTCCKNILHTGGNLSCCNVYAYNSAEHTCCNGSLYVGGNQRCENVTQQCGEGQVVVVACYKYCTCKEAVAGAKIPDHCGQVCEDCMGSKGELIGCAPKCECDVNNGYVRQKNRSSKCVSWQTCRSRQGNRPQKNSSTVYSNFTTTTTTTLSPRPTTTKYRTSYYSNIRHKNSSAASAQIP